MKISLWYFDVLQLKVARALYNRNVGEVIEGFFGNEEYEWVLNVLKIHIDVITYCFQNITFEYSLQIQFIVPKQR